MKVQEAVELLAMLRKDIQDGEERLRQMGNEAANLADKIAVRLQYGQFIVGQHHVTVQRAGNGWLVNIDELKQVEELEV